MRPEDLVPLVAQRSLDETAIESIVVDDQYESHGAPRLLNSCSDTRPDRQLFGLPVCGLVKEHGAR